MGIKTRSPFWQPGLKPRLGWWKVTLLRLGSMPSTSSRTSPVSFIFRDSRCVLKIWFPHYKALCSLNKAFPPEEKVQKNTNHYADIDHCKSLSWKKASVVQLQLQRTVVGQYSSFHCATSSQFRLQYMTNKPLTLLIMLRLQTLLDLLFCNYTALGVLCRYWLQNSTLLHLFYMFYKPLYTRISKRMTTKWSSHGDMDVPMSNISQVWVRS